MGYVSDEQRKAVHASKAEAAGKMLSPVSMFGSMGANPNINFLTNANALAAQQLAQQNVAPMQQPQVNPAMGIFGNADARNRSLYPSAMMKHADDKVAQIQKRIEEIRADYEEERKEGEFYEDEEYGKLQEQLKNIEKEHEK